jgi:hypothetical protein
MLALNTMWCRAGIEARSSKNEARASNFHYRASIRVSTTTNVNFNSTIRALNLAWYRAGVVALTITLDFYFDFLPVHEYKILVEGNKYL